MIDRLAHRALTRPARTRRPADSPSKNAIPAPATIALSLALIVAGCGKGPEPATISAAVAPTRPPVVKAENLPTVKFVDVTKESGVAFTHFNGAFGEKLLPETMGAGAAFFDYDNDGDQDLLFVNSAPWPGHEVDPAPTQRLYRNDGKGHFEDVTKEAGLDKTFYGQGVAIGDYDNDGDLDVYITAIGRGYLFRNDGKGRFEDATEAANAKGPNGWLTGASFLDIENDGDLDLFICNYITWTPEIDKVQGFQLTGLGRAYGPPTSFNGSLCALLRNDGERFTDISETSGVQVRTPDQKVPLGKSLGVAPFDLDGDGLVDVAVSNDTVQNFLFHNKGGGKFEEIALLAGVAFDQSGSPRGGMGCDWAYFLNDDRLGLAIGNFANEMTALYVSDQPSSLQFSDLANMYGLGAPTQPPLKFGLFFFDYDLDGGLDLLSANGHLEPEISKVQAAEHYEQAAQLLWNSGKGGRNLYVNIGPESAGPDLFKPIVGRGSAYADIDGDGDLDVVLTVNNGPARLLRNDGGDANHWVRVRLTGDGKGSNRDAIGAKVAAKIGGQTSRRQLFPAKSYLSSVELPLTFGLGKAEKIDELVVTWPSGKTTKLVNLKADHSYHVDESAGLVK
ncbi:MAG: CRTAC1 family protein [Paludisphaera borealis]|uniref:CRTAC1 family protein n=1 Tax=Paludisphaera borealis TaxID=1387353 RepID=UPI00285004A7|nr:CRTAC1 family protein [Paludisphaera borealis]MDR3618924.1 CRTAC1 family protein [Paludisphaera borealis]